MGIAWIQHDGRICTPAGAADGNGFLTGCYESGIGSHAGYLASYLDTF